MLHVIKTGRSPSMRYLARTHRVSVAWLHEVYVSGVFSSSHKETKCMAADIFTKLFAHPQNWLEVIRLTSVHPHPETQHNTSTTTFLVRPSIAYVGTLTAEDRLQEVAERADVPLRIGVYSNGMLPV